MNTISSYNSGLLTLSDVGEMLMLSTDSAVKNWLNQRDIKIVKFSKTNFVYEVEVVCEIQKQLAKNFKRNYPHEWQEMYKLVAPNDSIFQLVMIQLGDEVVYKPICKVKTRGAKDEKLLQELLSI
jgi:hypothetical protein